MRISLTTLLLLCSLARPVSAQDPEQRLKVAIVPGDTGRVVVAALEFLQKITRDTTVLANCQVDHVSSDTTQIPSVMVGSLRIRLPSNQSMPQSFCKPGATRKASGALVYVESLSQVKRDVILPYWDQVNVEVKVQIQYGLSTREWHTLTVRPGSARPTEKGLEVGTWRVSSWQVTGWMTH
jgi:hypothetical protein